MKLTSRANQFSQCCPTNSTVRSHHSPEQLKAFVLAAFSFAYVFSSLGTTLCLGIINYLQICLKLSPGSFFHSQFHIVSKEDALPLLRESSSTAQHLAQPGGQFTEHRNSITPSQTSKRFVF